MPEPTMSEEDYFLSRLENIEHSIRLTSVYPDLIMRHMHKGNVETAKQEAVNFRKTVKFLCTYLEELQVPKSISKELKNRKKYPRTGDLHPPFSDYFLTTRIELSPEKLRAMESTLRTIRNEINELWSVLR
jgi:hypothetical protein